MALNAEPLFEALLARFTPLSPTPFVTLSRRGRHFSEVLASEQPALFIEGRHQKPMQTRGLGAVWEIGALLTIYCRNDDPAVAPMTQINSLIHTVRQALERQTDEQSPMGSPRNQTTLGGLCQTCWISDKDPHGVVIDEGLIDQQAAIFIPIDMIVVEETG